MSCPKDFACYASGFENLCRAKDIGLETYLGCLDENPQACKFSLFFGYSCYGESPLRVYLLKKLKK